MERGCDNDDRKKSVGWRWRRQREKQRGEIKVLLE
jgi:hypothetical protein